MLYWVQEGWAIQQTKGRRRQEVILAYLDTGQETRSPQARRDELRRLTEAAGGHIVASVDQARNRPDPATCLGSGKVAELAALVEAQGVPLVIFERDLRPVQQRNLEDLLDCTVLDRTGLILDIFARRAQTREGQLQVELAQLEYLLPRLRGRGDRLSRLGAGIGTRGPGETKLETDLRRIRRRVHRLRDELGEVAARRQRHHDRRHRARLPVVAVVGYTNAGKSTLLNRLLGRDEMHTEDQPFATLDPTIRRIEAPAGEPFLATDTVGFIHDLPHGLIAAFRATLESVRQADLLLHVVDAAQVEAMEQVQAVERVLVELNAHQQPRMTALNKLDLLEGPPSPELLRLPGAVGIAAETGRGIQDLHAMIQQRLRQRRRRIAWCIPYDLMEIHAAVHERGKVLRERYASDGIHVEAELERSWADRVEARCDGLAADGMG